MPWNTAIHYLTVWRHITGFSPIIQWLFPDWAVLISCTQKHIWWFSGLIQSFLVEPNWIKTSDNDTVVVFDINAFFFISLYLIFKGILEFETNHEIAILFLWLQTCLHFYTAISCFFYWPTYRVILRYICEKLISVDLISFVGYRSLFLNPDIPVGHQVGFECLVRCVI